MTARPHEILLAVRELTVRFRMRGGREVAAVTDASFDLAAGECLALVGESGCGKSVLASALLGLLPGNARTRGRALLHGGEGRGGHGRGGAGDGRGGQENGAASGGSTCWRPTRPRSRAPCAVSASDSCRRVPRHI